MPNSPKCDDCNLAEQIESCGPELKAIIEIPPSRHAWGDVAVCPRDGCGRQFLFIRRDQGDDSHI